MLSRRRLLAERLEDRRVFDASATLIDINQSGEAALYDKSVVVGNKLYFVDTDRQNGAELRVLDSTTQTVSLVADINPGFGDSSIGRYGDFTTIGTKLFFTAYDIAEGFELRWIDTAVASPTVNTISVASGAESSRAGQYGGFIAIGTKLYFSAFDPVRGTELRWIDTALASPTVNTINFASGAASSNAGLTGFTAVGEKLYFAAADTLQRIRLRWIDTSLTTPVVNTVNVATPSSGEIVGASGGFIAVGTKLYFTAEDTANGFALRWIDTTLATPTVNVIPGIEAAGRYGGFISIGTKLYFSAYSQGNGFELRWIDTTLATPVVNTIEIATGFTSSNPGEFTGFKGVGTKLFFSAYDDINGTELRWIDTSLVSPSVNTISMVSGSSGGLGDVPEFNDIFTELAVVGTNLYFTAYDPTNGSELRWIDTSVASPSVNTISVAAGTIGSEAGRVTGLKVIGSRLYFVARDETFNSDLFWIDAQANPLVLNRVAISENSASSYAGSSTFGGFQTVGDKVYFTANDPQTGNELRWIDTSVSLTTINTLDIAAGATSSSAGLRGGFISVGAKLYFTAQDAVFGEELRWIDTSLVTPTLNTIDVSPGAASSLAGFTGFIAVGNKLFFTGEVANEGRELRWIDTTLASPVVNTISIASGNSSSNAGERGGFAAIGTKLYFSAFDADNGYELRWIETALASPVVNTLDINPGAASGFTMFSGRLQAVGSKLYFSATDPTDGEELRWIDTSLSVPIINTLTIASGPQGSSAGRQGGFAVVGSRLLFDAYDALNGTEPRWIDTSLASPILNTLDIYSGPNGSDSRLFTTVDSMVYFSANDPTNGAELRWIDLALAFPVVNTLDIVNGSGSSFPGSFTPIGTKLYFTSADVARYGDFYDYLGRSLRWIETTATTPTVRSISGGAAGNVVAIGSNLYSSGSKPGYGNELFITSTISAPTNLLLSNQSIPENEPVSFSIGSFASTDPDSGDEFTYSLVAGDGDTGNANFSIDSAGNLVSNTEFNFEAQSQYTIRVRSTDSSGLFLEKNFVVSVTNVNEAPVAVNDSFSASENAVLSIAATAGLLLNDSDPESDTMTITAINGSPVASASAITLTSGAILTIFSTGRFTYDPRVAFNALDAGASAIDTFTYGVTAGGMSSIATVTITVMGVNDAPTASRVNGSTNEDGPGTTVSASVTDPDAADTLTFAVATPTTKGLVTNHGNGTFTYSPNGKFETLATGQTATDVFTYTVNDGRGGTATSSVVITISGQNDAPVAASDLATTSENTARTISVLSNDTDVDATDVVSNFLLSSVSIRSTTGLSVSPATAGTVSIVANRLVFTPGTGFDELALGSSATVIVDYTMTDDEGLPSSSSVVITVTGVNDAPMLNVTPVVTLTDINEDDLVNTGNTAASLIQGFSDTDIGNPAGIAITGVTGVASGTWQYSLNGGSSWLPLGIPSTATARLLSGAGTTNRVRFLPAPHFTGTVQITYRAWDQSQGTIGGTADISTNILTGGSTAFSTTIETATLKIMPINDAPSLSISPAPTLAAISEDLTTSIGNNISSMVTSAVVTDPDSSALRGIAIVGVSNASSGNWQYALDGGITWVSVGLISPATARLLPSNAALSKLRFVPLANFNGTVQVSYRAWDQTQGIAGGTANLTVANSTGSSTAFSSEVATASLVVTPVNDAPVLTTTPIPVLDSIDEDNKASMGTSIPSLVGSSISDNDLTPQNIPLSGIAIIGVTGTTTGLWQYSLASGSSWINLGEPTTAIARLLPNTIQTRLRYVPNDHFNGSVTLTYRAWDQTTGTIGGSADLKLAGTTGGATAFSTARVVTTLTVRPVNDAPVWKATSQPQFASIKEDEFNAVGTTIASLVQGAVDDNDANPLSGIAVYGLTNNALGKWQYTLNGGTNWTDLLTATHATARLLPANGSLSRIRFVPVADRFGSVELRFYAWDQTQGTAGSTSDVATAIRRGGSTSFSSAGKTATLSITSVNDAPVLDNSAVRVLGTISKALIGPITTPSTGLSFPVTSLLNGISSDVDASSQRGIAVIGVAPSSRGVWWYTFDDLSFFAINTASSSAAVLIPANALLQFVPSPGFVTTSTLKATLQYRSWDQTSGNPRDIVNLIGAGKVGLTSAYSAAIGTAEAIVVL